MKYSRQTDALIYHRKSIAYAWAREVDFPQINIDLIAGMIGETEEKWRETVKRALELEPDSVTIYQMELPYNTVISQDILKKGIVSPIAGWTTKRRWLDYAFEQFLAHDYDIAGSDLLRRRRRLAGLFTGTVSGTAAT